MEIHHSNRNFFTKPLPELLDKFYSADALWAIFCRHIYPMKQLSPPQKRPKKAAMVEELLAIFSSPKRMRTFYKTMPENLIKALTPLVWDGDIPAAEIENWVGFEVVKQKTIRAQHSWGREEIEYHLPAEYLWIVLEKQGRYYTANYDTQLRLPPALRALFREHFPKPAGYYLEPTEQLPKNAGIRFRCDDELAEDWRVVSDYIKRGHLEYTKAEKIKKPCIRALAGLTNGGEFFMDDKSSAKLPFLRHELLANILASTGGTLREAMLKESPDPASILRPLVDELFNHPEWLAEFVLTHISGTPYVLNDEKDSDLKKLFSMMSSDQWISWENLHRFVCYRDFDYLPISFERCSISIEPIRIDYYSQARIDINQSNGWEVVILPLLKGMAFLLAALGLAEIAYEKPHSTTYKRKSEEFLTPYDGLSAIRLTPAGAYALGLSDEVELKSTKKERAEILLNPQRLTATCRNIDPITEMSLLEFMEKVSDGCYRMTRKTLLKGCSKATEVNARAEAFRAQICRNPPEFWEQFLDNTEKTARALRSQSAYTVYELADSPELRHLFLSDPLLREKTIKVQGIRVAIKKADFAAVSRRLTALGYLVG